jgi:type II secretion system protein G
VIAALNKKRDEDGFTLIELLIVIVILGILAAIVVFAVGTTGQNAAATSCKADAKTVEVALEAFKAQNGAYPNAPASPTDTGTSSTGWGALLNNSTSGSPSGSPYLRAVPGTSHYLIWWDSPSPTYTGGRVYVTAAGSVYPATTSSMDFDASGEAACSVAK